MSESFLKEESGANFSQGLSEDGNDTSRDVEMKEEIKFKEEPCEGKIKYEPLEEDDRRVKKEVDAEEGKYQGTDVTMKEEIKVKNEPSIKMYADNAQQKSMKDEEMKFKEEINSIMEEEINDDCDRSSTMEDIETVDSSENIPDQKMFDSPYPYVNAIRNSILSIGRYAMVPGPGTFAYGGVLGDAELQLSVAGVGELNLPISYKQGQVLKHSKNCMAAPFGLETETLTNKLVRDAWQIDAKDVNLDKDFKRLIQAEIEEKMIPTLLGETFKGNQVKSEFVKLMYFEKGGNFLANCETEKIPGMLATLVVQLPADHIGGALVVSHEGETKVFDFEDNSISKYFFTAFFADCEYHLREINYGHQLLLIYNIVHKNPQSKSNPDNNDFIKSNNLDFKTTMKNSVSEWISDNMGPQYLALKLDDIYNTDELFQNLEGMDKYRADALCSCKDIEVYIVNLTKKERHSGCKYQEDWYGDIGEEFEECSYTINDWISVDNYEHPFGEIEIDTNQMLSEEEDMFGDVDEDDVESEHGFSHKCGRCHIDYTYKIMALVFWPKNNEIFVSCERNFSSELINCKKLSENNMDGALEMLKEILFFMENGHKGIFYQLQIRNNVATIFEIMSLFDYTILSLANTFLLMLVKVEGNDYRYSSKRKVGLPNQNSAVALANLINKVGWDSLETNIRQLVSECAVSHTLSCTQLICSLLSLGLHKPVITVMEAATSQIIKHGDNFFLRGEPRALWALSLASHDIFSSYFDDFVKLISKVRDDILVEIIAKIHGLQNHNLINEYIVKKCCQDFLHILQDNGWKRLSVKSITLLWPAVLYVYKFNEVSIPYSFVRAIIRNKNSSNFLKELLKLPNVVEAKSNFLVQTMVKKRLQQLEVPNPVFSWAQPNANLVASSKYFEGPELQVVSNFLRSNEETKTFKSMFKNKADANKFGQNYFKNGKYNTSGKYSAKYKLCGRGRDIECKVIKTKAYFDAKFGKGYYDKEVERSKKVNVMHEEAKVLKQFFCDPNETISRKRALE